MGKVAPAPSCTPLALALIAALLFTVIIGVKEVYECRICGVVTEASEAVFVIPAYRTIAMTIAGQRGSVQRYVAILKRRLHMFAALVADLLSKLSWFVNRWSLLNTYKYALDWF